MRKAWLGVALVLVVAGVFASQFYRQASHPPVFRGCYSFEGRRLVLGEGRLLIDGIDAGPFQYFKGDATKGPDAIAISEPSEAVSSLGLSPRQVWKVTPGGLQVPLKAGGHGTAIPCG